MVCLDSVHRNSRKWCGNLGFESGSFVLIMASALCLASALFRFCCSVQREERNGGRTASKRKKHRDREREREEEQEEQGRRNGEGGEEASKGCMCHRHLAMWCDARKKYLSLVHSITREEGDRPLTVSVLFFIFPSFGNAFFGSVSTGSLSNTTTFSCFWSVAFPPLPNMLRTAPRLGLLDSPSFSSGPRATPASAPRGVAPPFNVPACRVLVPPKPALIPPPAPPPPRLPLPTSPDDDCPPPLADLMPPVSPPGLRTVAPRLRLARLRIPLLLPLLSSSCLVLGW